MNGFWNGDELKLPDSFIKKGDIDSERHIVITKDLWNDFMGLAKAIADSRRGDPIDTDLKLKAAYLVSILERQP